MAVEHKEPVHHSGSLHGFILGVLIGVVITLLFTTKKGRRILKSLTDEGLDKVTKWEDLLEQKIEKKLDDFDQKLEEKAFVEVVEEPVTSVSDAPVTEAAEKNSKPDAKEKAQEPHHTVRRFFKAAKKK